MEELPQTDKKKLFSLDEFQDDDLLSKPFKKTYN